MDDVARKKLPLHLLLVGAIGLLWNAFGAYDYLMSELTPASYLAQMGLGADSLAYLRAMPAWLTAFWALGVWASLVGSVLLLARSRHAVTAFALSLLGLAVAQGYQWFVAPPPVLPPAGIELVIWTALLLQLGYALRQARKGLLR
ncbi:hypothetical protein [Novosphingobium sp.]|uniref:hypothetical protein n=1 Tax=Novosphingobium sp. TaxID=1874826 RepID=UPI0038B7F5FB